MKMFRFRVTQRQDFMIKNNMKLYNLDNLSAFVIVLGTNFERSAGRIDDELVNDRGDKTLFRSIRMTEDQYQKILDRAVIHTHGDMSKYIRLVLLTAKILIS